MNAMIILGFVLLINSISTVVYTVLTDQFNQKIILGGGLMGGVGLTLLIVGLVENSKSSSNSEPRLEIETKLPTGPKRFKNIIPGAAYCMDVWNNSTENEIRINANKCNENLNQKFYYDPFTNQIKTHCSKCLDVKRNDSDNGTNVIQYECNNGSKNQKWESDIQNKAIKSVSSGKCLQFGGPDDIVGVNTPLVIYDCDGSVRQQWGFE